MPTKNRSPHSFPRKPRSDSVLKTLPETRQAEIADHARTHPVVETVEWLAAGGLTTSAGALSKFLSWRAERKAAREHFDGDEAVQRFLKKHADKSQDELDALGQRIFSALAIESRDSLAWKRVQQIRLGQKNFALTERQVQIVEHREDLAEKAEEAEVEAAAAKAESPDPGLREDYKQILGMT